MPISTSENVHCTALLVASLTHVRGAITSVQTFTFSKLVSNRGSKCQQ